MKTYKQRHAEVCQDYYNLQKKFQFLSYENNIRIEALSNPELFDPVKFVEIHEKLSKTVDAIEGIKSLELINRLQSNNKESKSIIECICDDVLLKLFGPLGKNEA